MRLTAGLCPALTDEVMTKLKNAGIKTIIDFMLRDSETLARETSVSYKVRLSYVSCLKRVINVIIYLNNQWFKIQILAYAIQ